MVRIAASVRRGGGVFSRVRASRAERWAVTCGFGVLAAMAFRCAVLGFGRTAAASSQDQGERRRRRTIDAH